MIKVKRRYISAFFLIISIVSTMFAFRLIIKEHQEIANYVYDEATSRAALHRAAAGVLTPSVIDARVNAALDERDVGLAASYRAIADDQGIALGDATQARLDAAATWHATTLRNTTKGTQGCLTGEGDSLAHISGAVACDFTVYGDLRDVTKEAFNYATGQEVDQVILGLSGLGIALTAGTYMTAGATAPAKVGVSILKFAKATGRLSARFAGYLAATTRAAVPPAALRRELDAVPFTLRLRRLETDALRDDVARAFTNAVNPGEAAKLARVADNLSAIKVASSTETAVRALRLVDTPEDLTKLRRIADVSGSKTLAYTHALGKPLLHTVKSSLKVTTKLFFKYVWAFMSLILSLLAAILVFSAERLMFVPLRRAFYRVFVDG